MIDRQPRGPAVLDGSAVSADAMHLSFADPVAQWGLGVFETIAVHDAQPRWLEPHLDRLTASAQRLGVPLPARSELTRAASLVGQSQTEGPAWLKIVISRSGRWAVYGGPFAASEHLRAISVVVLPWRRHRLDPTVGIKSIGYAASLLGLEEAQRRGADEGLWLNDRGHVIGACTANIFIARHRAVVTPDVRDGARDGVTRSLAIPALRAMGWSVRTSKLRVAALLSADEVFLTSSLHGVRPVARIDGHDVRRGAPGPLARRLAEQLADRAVTKETGAR